MSLQGHAPGSGHITHAHQPYHEAHAHGHTMLLNPAIPQPQPYSTPDQQGPLAYDSPSMHYTMSTQPPTTSMDASNTQRQHRLTSSSEDEVDTKIATKSGKLYGAPKEKKINAHLSIHQTQQQKHAIHMNYSHKRQIKTTQT